MSFSTSQRALARAMLYAVGVGAIISLIFWAHPFAAETVSERAGAEQNEGPEEPSPITNGTLGVQKIFAISIPSRLDKRDNIVLGSSLSDFHVEFIDAITPDEINPKTYPFNWNYDHRPVEYAARRSHLNALQKIVHDGLGSAIIMEDDADWDVSLKTQLQSFAIAVRALQSSSSSTDTNPPSKPQSPYGSNWDILWLGHCGITCNTSQPSFLTPNDPTIPPPHHFLPYWRDPPPPPPQPSDSSSSSRLTCAITDGVCSLLYAVSQRGARKLLAALSVSPAETAAKNIDTGAQFDVSLGRLCGAGDVVCYAPFPALTGGYTAPGAVGRMSDINGDDEGGMGPGFEGVEVQGERSHGVVYSVMMNVGRLIRGETVVRAHWGDVERVEVEVGGFGVLGGRVVEP
ncbi:hypothetical protein BJX64DRAFT_282396 [Aspergillus heterothallicus]